MEEGYHLEQNSIRQITVQGIDAMNRQLISEVK